MKLTNTESSQGWHTLILLMGMFFSMGLQAAPEQLNSEKSSEIFARVGEEIVAATDFFMAYQVGKRDKFYHGKPSETERTEFISGIQKKLIEAALLVQEARKRKLEPDNDVVEHKLATLDSKNMDNPRWKDVRDSILIKAREKYEKESLKSKLEMLVRDVSEPDDKQLQEYYAGHRKEFTAPDQLRVSLIMLRVDPGSEPGIWKAAGDFALNLIEELKNGADFAETANKYSDDRESAEIGGDMGYLHGGMLGGLAEHHVTKLKPGEMTDVVTFMEGVGILKLVSREVGKVNKLDDVRSRAGQLWSAEESDRRYNALIKKLKDETDIYINKAIISGTID